ncbi:carbohydrate kinase domain-containing protein, putative [Cryptosporidium muris RN66]|uniref:ATP-dependent (S)-NAD(P)H-hydrate dehydratase n=1 Tax=Cryptosporidium muris (strain RN66) TaxID=441375 RepID=B6AES4_CRYMR|nr:carbohydrate kinase domain-containing protein, putative [Cryptosporidium muris RN66]EEA06691.1 carbohydrate kinase domain-containing protein, putative [Cryptosporidium muris RN66]|eukprot:XP_002141040.1 carbohydrate kinase domain-containing protein [Cryptosporidium muris RN66]
MDSWLNFFYRWRTRTNLDNETLQDMDKTVSNEDVSYDNKHHLYDWYPPISQGKLIDAVRSIVPQLNMDLRKGSLGKIGVIGGSLEYTGASYFAGISSLTIGADLCHIFCTPEASLPIKSYSPDLIVHPLLPSSNLEATIEDCTLYIDNIRVWLPKMDVIIIGCGLGRNKNVLKVVSELIRICRSLSVPLVIDADGLYLVSQQPELICGYKHCILTPNTAEFFRFEKSIELANSMSSETLIPNIKESSPKSYSQAGTATAATSSYSHIELNDKVSDIEIIDNDINIPQVLPLGMNEDLDIVSPCERTPNIECPSNFNNPIMFEIYDDGEEINLYRNRCITSDSEKSDIPENKRKSFCSTNPLNWCFYEHIILENCTHQKYQKDTKVEAFTQLSHLNCEQIFNKITKVVDLSRSFGNVCIVLKGKFDIITNGKVVAICNLSGSYKRCGGQGDILAGCIAPLFYWSIQSLTNTTDETRYCNSPEIIAAYGACCITRLSAHIAFKKFMRSLNASHIIDDLSHIFRAVFETSSNITASNTEVHLLFNDPTSPKHIQSVE